MTILHSGSSTTVLVLVALAVLLTTSQGAQLSGPVRVSVMKMSAMTALEVKVMLTVSAAAENFAIATRSDEFLFGFILLYVLFCCAKIGFGRRFYSQRLALVYFVIYMCRENYYSSLINVIDKFPLI